jgi:hypothetical protein
VAGGIDTAMAEQMVAWQCSITLPRCSSGVELPCPAGDDYISLLDECGGHTNEYHFHERLTCLYDDDSEGHSPQIGIAEDGNPVYGQWEVTLASRLIRTVLRCTTITCKTQHHSRLVASVQPVMVGL